MNVESLKYDTDERWHQLFVTFQCFPTLCQFFVLTNWILQIHLLSVQSGESCSWTWSRFQSELNNNKAQHVAVAEAPLSFTNQTIQLLNWRRLTSYNLNKKHSLSLDGDVSCGCFKTEHSVHDGRQKDHKQELHESNATLAGTALLEYKTHA